MMPCKSAMMHGLVIFMLLFRGGYRFCRDFSLSFELSDPSPCVFGSFAAYRTTSQLTSTIEVTSEGEHFMFIY